MRLTLLVMKKIKRHDAELSPFRHELNKVFQASKVLGVGLLLVGNHGCTLIDFKLEKMSQSAPGGLPFLIDKGSIDVLIHAQHMNVIISTGITLDTVQCLVDQRACSGADLFL